MYEVVVLALGDPGEAGQVRTPVRACADALAAGGAARVEPVTATSDAAIDEALDRLDRAPDPGGDIRPAEGGDTGADGGDTRLVVAVAGDSQLRAVVRRMVRRWAPPPSRRPADLPPGRTVPDLPALGILPLDPGSGGPAARLGLPREPAAVAAAVAGGRVRRLDLLRQDGPSAVTLDGALLGTSDRAGRAVPWRARVEVDDAVLSDGSDPLLAVAVANADGYARPDGLPLVPAPDPADGTVAVAVAVPVRRRWRRTARVEVRRARGRAVVVDPGRGGVALVDDGVAGELTRRRTWWVEPGAWAVYTPPVIVD